MSCINDKNKNMLCNYSVRFCDEYDPFKKLCNDNYVAHCCCMTHMLKESGLLKE